MKKLLQKFFRGYLILEKIDSKINGEIEIREDIFGKRRLLAGGISQSGHLVEKLWESAIKKVFSFKFLVKSCLILGLGTGSAAKVIHNYFPKAKILGIEIDPLMIKLGKKYFSLAETKNLDIKIADAISIISNQQSAISNQQLRLIDLYLGDKVPKQAETDEFIKNVKNCLSSSGTAIFNRLYYGQKKEEAEKFKTKLDKVFSKVEPLQISASIFFLCHSSTNSLLNTASK